MAAEETTRSSDAGIEEPAAPDRVNGSSNVPSMQYTLGSILRWSDRLVSRVVARYDRFFDLEREDRAQVCLSVAQRLKDEGRRTDAIAALRRALDLEPDNEDTLFELGKLYLEDDAPDAAVEALSDARQAGHNGYELHCLLAEAYRELDRNEDAAEELLQAVEAQPDAAEAYYSLGIVLDRLDRPQEAVAAFERAIELSPKEVDYYQSLGFTLEGMGERERAIACFKRGVELERRFRR
jgi:tetratricopeptide (TPR) repeat protein